MKCKSTKRKLTKVILPLLAAGLMALPSVQAAEEDAEFSLDKVIVTAMREESKDLTTPAYVHVLSNEQLQATGATSLMEALKYQEGFSYYSQGPMGHSGGSMASRMVIRGVEKGTLVLVNGVPMNLNGWYQLDSIPLENIEKVEVVSGGGSVLYGSEAFGGVINIITKKKVENSYSTSFGSYGSQDQSLSIQAGKLSLSGQYSELGKVERITGLNYTVPASPYYLNYDGNQRTNLAATYVFNPNLTLRYDYTEDHIDRSYHLNSTGALYGTSGGTIARIHDEDKKTVITALYEKDSVKMTAFYNHRNMYDANHNVAGVRTGSYTDNISILGYDAQNSWKTGYGKLLLGVGTQSERYEKTINAGSQSPIGPLTRNNYFLYVQNTLNLNDKNTLILGAREHMVRQTNEQDRNELLPQLQFLHRISDTKSWFVDVNKSFRMPTPTEKYVINTMLYGNPQLKPETGWSYETGWKIKYPDADLKVAVYSMNITDKIDYVVQNIPGVGSRRKPENFQSFKNVGIETRYEKHLNPHWSYQAGASYSDPKVAGSDGQYNAVYNKLQFTGGVTYTQDRWTTNVSADYIGVRAKDLRPMLPVNLTVRYKVTPTGTWTFAVDNLLNREDITTVDAVTGINPAYYAMPRSFRLAYTSQF